MKIVISAESTIDLQKDLLEQLGIKTVPFGVFLGDKEYKDGEITTEEVFEYVTQTGVLPKTNAVNRFAYEEHFNNLLKEYDAVIHVSLSSELSSAYENAKAVASGLNNVYVIDSRSLSTGISLLCVYAKQLAEKIEEPKKIVEMVTDRIKSLQVSFVVDKLDYLYKGGRCSSLAAFGANLLKLHPRIVVSNGSMKSDKKYRGNMDKVVCEYVTDTLNDFNTPDKSIVFLTYTSATEETLVRIENQLKENGFANVYKTKANCTIASHCGPKTLGILYFNDGNVNQTL